MEPEEKPTKVSTMTEKATGEKPISRWVKALTPDNTEEIKPGLFIQTIKTWHSSYYRKISPAAWDGKIIWYNFFFGQNFWKTTLWFLLIMIMAYGYWHDTIAYREFYNYAIEEPDKFCSELTAGTIKQINITNLIPVKNGENTNSLFGYS